MTMTKWDGDITQSLKWMHSSAPNVTSLIQQKANWYEKYHTQFWTDWQTSVFNLDTANNFGLMIWCIILGVPSQLFGLYPPDNAFAYGANRQNFVGVSPGVVNPNLPGGNFYGGGNFTLLTSQEIRWALKLRYAALVSNGSLSFINRMLQWIFNDGKTWDYGSGKYFYVTDCTGTVPVITNLVANPEDTSTWSKVNGTAQYDVVDSPYAGTKADVFIEAVGVNSHTIRGSFANTSPAGQPFNASVYVKAAGRSKVQIRAPNGAVVTYASFDLANGTIIANTFGDGSNPQIFDVGNGWFRIAVDIPGIFTANSWAVGLLDSDGNRAYNGDGVSGANIWGMQTTQGVGLKQYKAVAAPAIHTPPTAAFKLDYHVGPNMGFSPQFINLLNAAQYGVTPSCAGSLSTVTQD